MISAPRHNGVCNAGVQKQLSTINLMFASCARFAKLLISHISVNGLDGVSTKKNLVFLVIAFFH